MVSVAEAERLVFTAIGRLPTERCKLKEAAGRILRQELNADREGPPFDRATLDGVCLRHAEWAAGRREFAVAGMQPAGAEPVAAPAEGACLEIMTGAPVPAPCDCVLPVEDFVREGDAVRAKPGAALAAGNGVHPRGSDYRSGDRLVSPGGRLTGREIAIAASCGYTQLEVTVAPKIAVLTTGDELVDVEDAPKPHQIRRSNDLALRAVLEAAGFAKIELNHLPDNPQAISWNLERLLQQVDAILVTGGVSKGRFDFLPGTLKELGVTEHFHGVAQRPGKPMWFGTFARAGDFLHPENERVVAVFALPGNPVSSFICAHRYALPALVRMSGVEDAAPPEFAQVAAAVRLDPQLARLLPVKLRPREDGRMLAEPCPPNTSGDFASIARTEGFVEIAPGAGELPAGAAARLFRWV